MLRYKIYFVLLCSSWSVIAWAQPAITSFSPQSGPIGTMVTISGTNFSATTSQNMVYIGAVRAVVSSSMTTSLIVYVPQGVTYEPIAVTVAGSTAYSTKPFIVTKPAPVSISSTSFAAHADFAVTTAPVFVSVADYDYNGAADISVTTNLTTKYNFSAFRNTTDCKNLSLNAEQDFFTNDAGAPTGSASADFDGDGKLDAAVSTPTNKLVDIFQNLSYPGTINFSNGTPLGALGFGTGDVKIADMDSDGKPDIVVALFNALGPASGVAIYRNTSTGIGSFGFSAPQTITFTTNPKGIALADIDGDGKQDIILADATTNVRIRRNKSVSGTLDNSSFDPEVSFTTAITPQDVKAGDIDGDGKTDLVVGCSAAISVLRNTSTSGAINTSSFASKIDFTGVAASSVGLGDLNGDGKVDVTVSNGSNVSVFQNQAASGSITTSSLGTNVNFSVGTSLVSHVALADINDDGYLDLMATQSGKFISIFLYNPPVASAPAITSFTPASGVANSTVTINGNNFGTSTATNQVYIGTVKASITSATATKLVVMVPPYATFGPITVENLTNNLSGSTKTNFTPVFDNNKDFGGRIIPASMGKKIDIDIGSSDATGVNLGDIDGDGFVDMIISGGSSDTLIVFRNKGNKILSAPGFEKTSLHFDTDGNHPAFARDMDNDGKLDIVMMARGVGDQDEILIYHNEGTPGSLNVNSFGPVYQVHLPYLSINNSDFTIADMDGDGKQELICENSGKVSVFKNNSLPGGFCFAPSVDITVGSQGLTVGDIDGDGKLDIAVAGGYYGTAGFKLIRNTSTIGSLTFGAPVIFSPTGTGNIINVNIADLDNDGKPDVSWVGFLASGGNGLHIMKNQATPGTIDASSLANEVTYFWSNGGISPYSYSTVGDLNGDGKTDIIGTGSVSGGVQVAGVFQNVSQTGVIDPTSFLEGVGFEDAINYSAQYPAIGDLDGDGKPEIITTNASYSTHIISIYHNETYPVPQLDLLKNNSGTTQTGPLGSDLFTQGNYQFTNNDNPTVRFGTTPGVVDAITNTSLSTKVPAGASQDRVSVTLHGLTGFSAQVFNPTFSTTGSLDATTFSTKVDYPLLVGATPGLAISDFDNDGKTDIAAGDGGNIRLFRNTLTTAGGTITTTTFTALSTLTASMGNAALSAGDFDGDGYIDLQGNSSIFHNNSGTQADAISFEAAVNTLGGVSPTGGRTRTNIDFNHDGKIDILSSASGGAIFVSENLSRKGAFTNGSFPTFNTAITYNIGGITGEAAPGDFDGDGYDDIVFLSKSANQLQYKLNTKLNRAITTAQFAATQNIATAVSPAYLIVKDLDLDGKPDVVVGYSTVATISVFRNTSTTGAISFTRQDFPSIANTNQLDAADLDGDGKAEIVTIHGINSGPFNFSILKNTSTTGISFAPKIDYSLATQPVGLILADINQDAKTDIVISRSGLLLSVFQNQLPGGVFINITTQPVTTSTCSGGAASFTVNASGTTNLSYQWLKFNTTNSTFEAVSNSTVFGGVTTSTLTINAADNSVEGNYKCKISGDNASDVYSTIVTLILTSSATPVITSTGSTLQASSGDSYQWYSAGATVQGATSQTFEIPVLEYGSYAVDVTSNGCIAHSADFIYLVTAIENPALQLAIYPNPVKDELMIEFSNNAINSLRIIDLVGKEISVPVQETSSGKIVSTKDLRTGIYILVLQLEQSKIYYKILKE